MASVLGYWGGAFRLSLEGAKAGPASEAATGPPELAAPTQRRLLAPSAESVREMVAVFAERDPSHPLTRRERQHLEASLAALRQVKTAPAAGVPRELRAVMLRSLGQLERLSYNRAAEVECCDQALSLLMSVTA
ncbi:MAG: hypothetical protein KDA47_18935 [Planctomycetales bacterium]|nr:hypothetical protein [Planctomycetales bacterium]